MHLEAHHSLTQKKNIEETQNQKDTGIDFRKRQVKDINHKLFTL